MDGSKREAVSGNFTYRETSKVVCVESTEWNADFLQSVGDATLRQDFY